MNIATEQEFPRDGSFDFRLAVLLRNDLQIVVGFVAQLDAIESVIAFRHVLVEDHSGNLASGRALVDCFGVTTAGDQEVAGLFSETGESLCRLHKAVCDVFEWALLNEMLLMAVRRSQNDHLRDFLIFYEIHNLLNVSVQQRCGHRRSCLQDQQLVLLVNKDLACRCDVSGMDFKSGRTEDGNNC